MFESFHIWAQSLSFFDDVGDAGDVDDVLAAAAHKPPRQCPSDAADSATIPLL